MIFRVLDEDNFTEVLGCHRLNLRRFQKQQKFNVLEVGFNGLQGLFRTEGPPNPTSIFDTLISYHCEYLRFCCDFVQIL